MPALVRIDAGLALLPPATSHGPAGIDLALVTKVWVIEHRDGHTQLRKQARSISEGGRRLAHCPRRG
jgi:hypothetical protein